MNEPAGIQLEASDFPKKTLTFVQRTIYFNCALHHLQPETAQPNHHAQFETIPPRGDHHDHQSFPIL
jgi:hypothetical protein